MVTIGLFSLTIAGRDEHSIDQSVLPLTPEILISKIAIRHRRREGSLGVLEVGPEDKDEEPTLKEDWSDVGESVSLSRVKPNLA